MRWQMSRVGMMRMHHVGEPYGSLDAEAKEHLVDYGQVAEAEAEVGRGAMQNRAEDHRAIAKFFGAKLARVHLATRDKAQRKATHGSKKGEGGRQAKDDRRRRRTAAKEEGGRQERGRTTAKSAVKPIVDEGSPRKTPKTQKQRPVTAARHTAMAENVTNGDVTSKPNGDGDDICQKLSPCPKRLRLSLDASNARHFIDEAHDAVRESHRRHCALGARSLTTRALLQWYHASRRHSSAPDL